MWILLVITEVVRNGPNSVDTLDFAVWAVCSLTVNTLMGNKKWKYSELLKKFPDCWLLWDLGPDVTLLHFTPRRFDAR